MYHQLDTTVLSLKSVLCYDSADLFEGLFEKLSDKIIKLNSILSHIRSRVLLGSTPWPGIVGSKPGILQSVSFTSCLVVMATNSDSHPQTLIGDWRNINLNFGQKL